MPAIDAPKLFVPQRPALVRAASLDLTPAQRHGIQLLPVAFGIFPMPFIPARASLVTPGNQTLNSSSSFVVPAYNTLTATLWGAGGGGTGAGGGGGNGTDGGDTTFQGMTAGGGKASTTGGAVEAHVGGVGGSASGGDTNTSGSAGGNGTNTLAGGGGPGDGHGGASPNGGAQVAAPTSNANGNAGNAPGGGGSGAYNSSKASAGGGGGAYCRKTYSPGDLTVGANLSVTIGAAGGAGAGSFTGGAGAVGRAYFEWA